MLSLTAENLMIPLERYPHIPYWATIRDAIAKIHNAEISANGRKSLARSLLVIDEDNKLLGIVRRRDILRGLEPECCFHGSLLHSKQIFEIKADPDLLEISSEALIKSIPEKANKKISEVMQPIKHILDYNDHIMTIIYLISETRMSTLPVIKEGVVVGVVRTVEVMDEIAKTLLVN